MVFATSEVFRSPMANVIREVAAEVTADGEPESRLRRFCAGLRRLGFRRTGIFLLDHDSLEQPRGTWITDSSEPDAAHADWPYPIEQFSDFRRLLDAERQGKVAAEEWYDDTPVPAAGPFTVGASPSEDTPRVVTVPLHAHGRLLGLIAAVLPSGSQDTSAVRTVALDVLAATAANVIARGKAEETLTEWINRSRLLSEVGAELAETTDIEASLARVANLAVPLIADFCVVHLVARNGAPRRVGFAHRDPAWVRRFADLPVLNTYRDNFPALIDGNACPTVWSEVRPDQLAAFVADQGEFQLIQSLDCQSAVFCPLVVRGEAIGSLSLVYGSTGRRYCNDDVGFAEDLSRQVAQGIASARLYEAERSARRQSTALYEATKQIARRRQIEEALRESQKMEAIGQLAGGVAHDFNNLVTVINGFCDLLQEQLPAGSEASDYVKQIALAGSNAADLTRQLLAFSRRQVVAPTELDLNQVVAQASRMLYRLVGEEIALEIDLAPNLGLIKADPGQVEQIILNLVTNARDAMPRGGHLTIETRNVEPTDAFLRTHSNAIPGRYVLLAVTDTGVGMTEEVSRRIFDPFFTTKVAGKGTGLGLAAVYGIAEQSGGIIEVDSAPDHGTNFRVYLPRVDAKESPSRGLDQAAAARGSETILVIEDAPAVRKLVRIALDSCGYSVLEAENGEVALRVSAEHAGRIDCLVTDVVMPGMSGREVAERLRQLRPDTRVLYTSGYTDDVILRHGVVHLGVDFLQKPFTPTVLTQKVRELLDRPVTTRPDSECLLPGSEEVAG